MTSLSSSSSRTLVDDDPGKQILDEGDEESLVNLNGLEIPHLSLSNSFKFMNEEEVLPDIPKVPQDPPPLSPETLACRENVVHGEFYLGSVRVSRRV